MGAIWRRPIIKTNLDQAISAYWRAGFDTLDIARELNVPEYEVANILLHLRESKGGVDAERSLVGSAQ